MNNYEALSRLSNIDLQQYGDDPFGDGRLTPLYACDCYREEFVTLLKSIDKLEKYKWHDLRKDPNDLPDGREWVLAIFKEPDSDFTLAPRVADYVGKQTPITTKENWIILDLDDTFDLSEYHRSLKCIAWKYIEDFEDE